MALKDNYHGSSRLLEERRKGSLDDAVRKLETFKSLYSSYRKEELTSQLSRSILPLQRDDNPVAPQPDTLAMPLSSRTSQTHRTRRRSSTSSLHYRPHQQPTVPWQPASPGRAAVGADQLPTVKRLLLELDGKDQSLASAQGKISRLQGQLQLQELTGSREEDGRAGLERQVQLLKEKLATAAGHLDRLESERWEVLEAVSTMAADSAKLDREQRELERTRLELAEKQRELASRQALTHTAQTSISPERISRDNVSDLILHYTELETALGRTDAAVRRRLLLLAGHDPKACARQSAGGGEGIGTLASGGSEGGGHADLSHNPSLNDLKEVRECMVAAASYLAAHVSAERPLSELSVTTMVQYLQKEAAGLGRALVRLASDTAEEAARLARAEAKDRERDAQLAALLAEKGRLAAQAAAAAQAEALAKQLKEQRQENEDMQARMRSMRKKLKVAFEDMAAQNKELREKLTAAQSARVDDGDRLQDQTQRLTAELAEANERLKVQQQRDLELVSQLQQAQQQVAAAMEQVEKLQAEASAAEARAKELETVMCMEREASQKAAADYEGQMANLRAEVREQLQMVVDAYSEELAALHAQLARVEQAQQLTPSPKRGAVGPAAAAAAAAGVGRAEAWRMAYEEVRELAHSLKAQLDAAETENTRLQLQLQRLTAAAVASAAAALGPQATVQPRPRQAAQGSTADPKIRAPAPPQPGLSAAVSATSPQALRRLVDVSVATQAGDPKSRASSPGAGPTSKPSQVRSVAVETEGLSPPARPKQPSPARTQPPAAARTDAAAATERTETRQQSAQTEAPAPPPQASSPVVEERTSNKLVIVLRQEPAANTAITHVSLEPAGDSAAISSPMSAQTSALHDTESHGWQARGRSPGPGHRDADAKHSSRHRGSSRSRSRRESPSRAAASVGCWVQSTGAAQAEGREPLHSQGSGSSDDDAGLDTGVLGEHVAALQEQLAALTYQNSVITTQVIEMRHRQEAQQLEQERRSRDVSQAQSPYGTEELPYGTSPSRPARPPLFTAAASAVFGGAGSPRHASSHSQHDPMASSRDSYPAQADASSPYHSPYLEERGQRTAPSRSFSPVRGSVVHIPGSSLRAPVMEEQRGPEEQYASDAAAELTLMRAQYAQLQARYELQATRQQELQEALLQASERSTSLGSGLSHQGELMRPTYRPASAAPAFTASEPPDMTAARLVYPRFPSVGRHMSQQPAAGTHVPAPAKDSAHVQGWLFPNQGTQDHRPRHGVQHSQPEDSRHQAFTRSSSPGYAATQPRSTAAAGYGSSSVHAGHMWLVAHQPGCGGAGRSQSSSEGSIGEPITSSGASEESEVNDARATAGAVQRTAVQRGEPRQTGKPAAAPCRAQEAGHRSKGRSSQHGLPPKTLRLQPPSSQALQQAASEPQERGPLQPQQQPTSSAQQLSRPSPSKQPIAGAPQQQGAKGTGGGAPVRASACQLAQAPQGPSGVAAAPLVSQRSGDLYIATTPFFPLNPETSDFLDRATSVEVGLHPDPDLAMTAADAALYEAVHQDDEPAEDDFRDDDEQGRATPGSGSSTFVGEDDRLAVMDEDDEDSGVVAVGRSQTVSSNASVSTSSTSTTAGARGVAAGPSAHHTTSSFLPVQSGPRHHQRRQHRRAPPGGHSDAAAPADTSGRPSGEAHRAGPQDGPLVPPEVLERMAQYAGDEGMARPSTAVPSVLRPDSSDRGPPVPPEVLSYLEQYTGGGEGDVRPSTASPSVLRVGAVREVPVPPEVLSYMQQYAGDEGGARPSSAAPSVLSTSRSMQELPVPELVLHMAAQFQAGGEGISRPTTAPSSDERRARIASGAASSMQSASGGPASSGARARPAPARRSAQGESAGTEQPGVTEGGIASPQETQPQQLSLRPQIRLQLQPPPSQRSDGSRLMMPESRTGDFSAGGGGYDGHGSADIQGADEAGSRSGVRQMELWVQGPGAMGYEGQEAWRSGSSLSDGAEHEDGDGEEGGTADWEGADGRHTYEGGDAAFEGAEEGPVGEASNVEEGESGPTRDSYASSSATFRSSLPPLQAGPAPSNPQQAPPQQEQLECDWSNHGELGPNESPLLHGEGEDDDGLDEEGAGAFRVVVGSWLQAPGAHGADPAGRPAPHW